MAVAVGKSTLVTDGLVVHLDPSYARNYEQLTEVEVLVVAGGGGGGFQHGGGGGGAGGVIYRSNYPVTPGTSISLSVGAGGFGGSSPPTNGQNSTFGVLTAIGGGYGGSESGGIQSGNSGGSGGGGSGFSTPTSGGSGTAGQGFRGGDGASRADAGSVYGSGGGGGGAGGPGARGAEGNEALGTAGDGGRGLLFNISGYPRYYGGGGGGGYWGSNFAGVGRGGIGGGGDGAGGTSSVLPSRPGKPNTGGGGGGSAGGGFPRDGASGGSGIVIVRYPGPQRATGGTISQSGGYTIHSFTSTGSSTFTPLNNTTTLYGLQDLSGNNNHFILFNNPTLNASRTFLSFSASSSQYARSISRIDLSKTDSLTVEVALKVNSITSNTMAFEHTADWNTNSGSFGFFPNSQGGFSNSPTTDNWIHTNAYNSRIDFNVPSTTTMAIYALTYVSGELTQMYYNGQLITNTLGGLLKSAFYNGFANDFTYIGSRGGTGFYGAAILDIGFFRVYNRKLSQTEIQQNFNLYRGRFGI